MEELSLLLGWLFRASNWLSDFVPQLEEARFGGHCGVAECRAVRPYSVWSVDYLELRKMVKVAYFQATALDAHVVGPECLCSILKEKTLSNEWGSRSLICGIRPTSSLFYGSFPRPPTYVGLLARVFVKEAAPERFNLIWGSRSKIGYVDPFQLFFHTIKEKSAYGIHPSTKPEQKGKAKPAKEG